MTAAVVPTIPERTVPPLGGFSWTFLRLEIRRLLRNRRTLIFSCDQRPAILRMVFVFLGVPSFVNP